MNRTFGLILLSALSCVSNVPGQSNTDQDKRTNLKAKYRARWAQDEQKYSPLQMADLESIYQIGTRKWGTPEGVEALKTVISKYSDTDRAGCAAVYLGQVSDGEKREQYLKQAIAKYSDAMYGDLVQVGAYARFLLATEYMKNDRRAEAEALISDIRSRYPDAVDHSGTPLATQLPK